MMFFSASVNFLPMLSITNGMTYDASQFWNSSSAIVAGVGFGAVAMLILPPLSPAIRTRRLLALTLADLQATCEASLARKAGRLGKPRRRSLAGDARPSSSQSSAPSSLQPSLSAKRSYGFAMSRLGSSRARMVDAALTALAEGRSGEAIERLKEIDRQVAALPRARSRILLRFRASILVISGQLAQFGSYFDRPIR